MILYVSDHDYIGAHRLWAKGLPCFREAYHICSMIGGGPVKNPGRLERAFVSLADWAPTFLELAGIEQNRKLAGKSLLRFIHDERAEDWREKNYSLRQTEMKYMEFRERCGIKNGSMYLIPLTMMNCMTLKMIRVNFIIC